MDISNQIKVTMISMVSGRFASGSFRLRSVRLRLKSIRLHLICQFAYESYSRSLEKQRADTSKFECI